jgi:hypothetical protein
MIVDNCCCYVPVLPSVRNWGGQCLWKTQRNVNGFKMTWKTKTKLICVRTGCRQRDIIKMCLNCCLNFKQPLSQFSASHRVECSKTNRTVECTNVPAGTFQIARAAHLATKGTKTLAVGGHCPLSPSAVGTEGHCPLSPNAIGTEGHCPLSPSAVGTEGHRTYTRHNIWYKLRYLFVPVGGVTLYRVVWLFFVWFWRDSPQWARASSFTTFLYHTQRRTTVGRTPLDEWSARRRHLYLTTHNIHNRQSFMPRWDSNPQFQQASGRRTTP